MKDFKHLSAKGHAWFFLILLLQCITFIFCGYQPWNGYSKPSLSRCRLFFSFVVVFLILPPTTSKYEKIWEAVILLSVFILLPFLRWIVSFAFMPQELVWFHNGGVLDVCTWASPFASDEVLFHSVSLHSCTKLYWKVNLALYKAHFNGEDFCKSFSSFPLLLELSSGSLGLFSKGNSFLRQLCNYGVIL